MPRHEATLAELIRTIKDLHALSHGDLARRAESHGFELSPQNVDDYLKDDQTRYLTPPKIRALAAALNVDYERVERAVKRTLDKNLGNITAWCPDDGDVPVVIGRGQLSTAAREGRARQVRRAIERHRNRDAM